MDFHVIDNGSGPAVLFIHAGVADSRMWRDQIGLPGLRTIAFDKRGFGKTPWIPGPYSDTDDSVAVLDRLGIETATVVGCSMGGATALDIVIDHPERVERLVLVGAYPSGWVPEGGFEESPLEEEAAAAAEAGDFDRVVELDFRMWVVGYGRSADEIDPDLKELFYDMDRLAVTTDAERGQHQTGFDKRLNDHLGAIDVPTLVICGAHDESLLVDAAHHLAAELSDRDALIIDGAAHLPSLERPDVFNEALLEFLGS